MAVSSKAKAKDYVAIAKKNITRPSKLPFLPSILVYARNKKGKSRFALSVGVENLLFIDPEHGTDTMKKIDPYVWHISKWEDLQDVWGALRTGEISPAAIGQGESTAPFSWVCLDGLTKINNFALKYVMRRAEERDLDRQPGIVDRRDYNKSGELMKQMLTNFEGLEMGKIYTAQERAKSYDAGDEDGESESTFFVPDLPDGVRGAVNSVVDVIGRLYTVRVEVKGDLKVQRRLQIGVHERYDTGYRSDYVLPDMIKYPTVPKLISAMLTGSTKKESS